MEEYVKEAEEVSFEGGVGESYDKEWALKDQAYRDGEEAGEKKGKEEGILTEKKVIAKSMLKDNISVEQISKYTGLSIEKIESLNT